MLANTQRERFLNGAEKYAAYLETPEGRLRTDLAFANLRDALPEQGLTSWRALDLGCGTGAVALRLAKLGVHVTLLDCSKRMLELAERAFAEAGVTANPELKIGDVSEAADLFAHRSFDVVVCHNVVEYVDDPTVVLRSLATLLRGPNGILSLLVRSQAGEVLKAAIASGDLEALQGTLDSDWGKESLYGGKVRLFTPKTLEATLRHALLRVIARRGVRIISDCLPERVSRSGEYEKIFALEQKLAAREEYFGVARYLQYLAKVER